MHKIVVVVNHPPIGSERTYNAFRYAIALVDMGLDVKVFLLGDGVHAAKRDKKVPSGYHNLTEMIGNLEDAHVDVRACITCCAARGLNEHDLIDGVEMGNMVDLARWTKESDGVVNF